MRAEAVVAAAFLDVVDLERALESIAAALEPGGLYAPITFDGATGFAPSHPLDDRIERLYHRHMDEIRDAGASTTGRQPRVTAGERLRDARRRRVGLDRPASVSRRGSGYPATERTFLQTILETIDEALAAYPADVLDPADRRAWLSTRRRQLEESELVRCPSRRRTRPSREQLIGVLIHHGAVEYSRNPTEFGRE